MSARVAARLHGDLLGEAPASGVAVIDMRRSPPRGIIYHDEEPICTVTVPVKTVSELNRHEHWRIRAKRAKAQHAAVADSIAVYSIHQANVQDTHWSKVEQKMRTLPLHVHLTRLSARKLDSDNLAGALKHCRDAVAKFLGVDDGDEAKVSWTVGQEQQKGYAVRVEFYRRQS